VPRARELARSWQRTTVRSRRHELTLDCLDAVQRQSATSIAGIFGIWSGTMTGAYRITRARPHDVYVLRDIELAAARLLEGYAPEAVLAEATAEDEFRIAQQDDLLWVALEDDAPVGFAHLKLLEPNAVHLQELDVHPAHGRRGIGTRLVTAVCTWAGESGHGAVTLTTFRDVPWNMPFYARLGFAEIQAAAISEALRSILDHEVRSGLDAGRRVAMQWRARARC
jgi:GNAT superfamily N-acetyltransferase